MFSGEQQWKVVLRMGRLSTAVLREEYPKAEKYIEQLDDHHWQAAILVCSFVGISRFVMGLFEDIEVVECDEFKDFMRTRINLLNLKTI
jgi:hypothetical protein